MIKLQNVQKSFNGQKVLDNLNLEIKAGEIYGLLGANGAGKSTTINLLLGFLKPDSGTLTMKGNSLKKTSQMVGYITENVNLYPYLNGIENLDYFCKLAGLKYNQNQLTQFLSDCGLQIEAHKKRTETYSKGMRQKVGIAIAYAKNAEIYLLDEPASGLDPSASNELSELLKKLAANGASILMASHDIFRVREVCDRIGILKNGSLVKELHSEEISANELEKLYLKFINN